MLFTKKKENLNFFALDIGESTIKVVKLKDTKKNPTLEFIGSTPTPFGIVGSENEEHKKALALAIKNVLKDLGIKTKEVAVSIPDDSIFSRIIRISVKKESDLEEAVFWATKRNVPIAPDEVQVDWSIVKQSEPLADGVVQYDILLVAAPKLLIERYVNILKMVDLTPVLIETESLSLVRSLSSYNDNSPSAIIDFGFKTTKFIVSFRNTLLFDQTIAIGSYVLTKAISQEFGMEEMQAEEYKKNYGLDQSQIEGKIYRSISPIMDSMINEIKRTINSYKAINIGDVPNKLIIVGNGSLLPNLVLYLAQNLSMEVEVGNPYSKIYIPPELKNKLPALLPGYAVAIGLALKV
ncbi:type IV pilus assembly protein PilM [Patescibacteria group bacterium]|nr:type IV pilus assembly protein PilM [Patescibacteria group bacterium]